MRVISSTSGPRRSKSPSPLPSPRVPGEGEFPRISVKLDNANNWLNCGANMPSKARKTSFVPGSDDYFALTELVSAYEQRRHPIDLRRGDHADGIDILKLLLEERGMIASGLGQLLGKRQLGSAILRRERQLSKAHVVKLAEYFGVSTDLLLRGKAAGHGQTAA
jgi:antitoxin component HigA of HigAB toxin-antitoxin module